ncbi:MAG: LytTR family DNA-binding domain-containing protein [Parafilimonas sp.]
MNCIIIDDEPKAIEIIERYIISTPFLKLLQSFRDPMDAINFLYTNKVDLIFLDINMPGISGVNIATLFQDKTSVIFTTAYSKYAIEGFELNAIDFLIKPVSFDRFLKAVSKAMELKLLRENNVTGTSKNINNENEKPLFIKSGTKIFKINISDILFLEKEGNYFNIHMLNNKKILIRMNFFDLFRYLPSNNFIRIHKSYIINLKHLDTIEGQNVFINTRNIPIGAAYKQELMNYMKLL